MWYEFHLRHNCPLIARVFEKIMLRMSEFHVQHPKLSAVPSSPPLSGIRKLYHSTLVASWHSATRHRESGFRECYHTFELFLCVSLSSTKAKVAVFSQTVNNNASPLA